MVGLRTLRELVPPYMNNSGQVSFSSSDLIAKPQSGGKPCNHSSRLWSRLWQASWQAACLAVLVWGLVRLLGARVAARWRFALWSLVFVRWALPVVPASPTSVFRLLQAPSTPTSVRREVPGDVSLASAPINHFSAEYVPEVPLPPTDTDQTVAEAAPIVAPVLSTSPTVLPVATPSRPRTPWNWRLSVALVWLSGVLVLGLRRGVQRRLLARRGKSWRRTDDPRVKALLAACCRRIGIDSKVSVLVSDDHSGPAITGTFRPRIVLPSAVQGEFSDEQLEMILLHELAHVRRRDLLVREAVLWLRVVHWFNPAAWWAFHRMEVEREIACDELVLDTAGADRRHSYGLTLLNVVQRASASALGPGLLGVSGTSSRLQRRLAMIRDYRPRSRKMTLLAVAAIVVASAVGLTNPPAAYTTDSPQLAASSTLSDAADGQNEATRSNNSSVIPSHPKNEKTFEVKGRCIDDDGKSLEGAQVVLFLLDYPGAPPTHTHTWRQKTDAGGEYRIGDLRPEEGVEQYILAAAMPNHASMVYSFPADDPDRNTVLLLQDNPGTLSGRVTNEKGEPVAGAEVYSGYPLPGFTHAVTGNEGRYSISDLRSLPLRDTTAVDSRKRARPARIQPVSYLDVRHADYPLTRARYSETHQQVDVQLKPGTIIEGRVVDRGEPAAGAVISVHGLDGHTRRSIAADRQGAYRVVLASDQYLIRAQVKDRTAVALEFPVDAPGKTIWAPDLQSISGGFIVGKVVAKTTGKPFYMQLRRARIAEFSQRHSSVGVNSGRHSYNASVTKVPPCRFARAGFICERRDGTRRRDLATRQHAPGKPGGETANGSYARISRTTVPSTSVSRKSRPA
ncbi:MAG: hypothetical protein EXS05_02695 [Planctomycetaceae bacterium]|nr:hypothetical protein [Planctomycetaceae bacterium]